MFTHKHYLPILKAKEGEFNALQETVDTTKNMMTPLFEIVNVPWDYENECEKKTIDNHLSKFGEKINTCWGTERRFFVDSKWIDGTTKMLDGITHHLLWLFSDFSRLGLSAIPVTTLDKHPDYKQAVRIISGVDKKGICIRLYSHDLTKMNFTQLINDEVLVQYGLTPNDVDIVIDLQGLNDNSFDLAMYTITNVLNFTLPNVMDWRTITVCGTSFPVDLTEISANTIDSIDRTEWRFWNNLLATPLKRKPTFGDYSISHWDIADLDPRYITMSASIRYTADDYWLIVRGRSIKQGGSGQFYNLCQNLIGRSEYCGAGYSWGDNYINECAARAVGPGNPTTWRKVGNNHHFQKVVTQLAIAL